MNSLGREIRLNRLFSPKDGRMVACLTTPSPAA